MSVNDLDLEDGLYTGGLTVVMEVPKEDVHVVDESWIEVVEPDINVPKTELMDPEFNEEGVEFDYLIEQYLEVTTDDFIYEHSDVYDKGTYYKVKGAVIGVEDLDLEEFVDKEYVVGFWVMDDYYSADTF